MYSRRQFLETSLKTAPLVSLAATVPGFLPRSLAAAESANTDRILVVIELNGGNDGINTVVPFADEHYPKVRKTLRIPESQIIKLNDSIGLHPGMRGTADLVEDGRLTIVQGVGYPNPDRSHFRSMAIWQSARFDPVEHSHYGWLGRALDQTKRDPLRFADSLCVGDVDPPLALRGRTATQATIRSLEDVQLDRRSVSIPASASEESADDLLQFVERRSASARATADRIAALAKEPKEGVRYPNTGLGNRLRSIARLIQADLNPRVYYTVQSGYDTHIGQYNEHFQLLGEFSGALKAFLDDLREAKLADRVLVLAFSEFGRRVEENASQGTDHGTAGPVFVAGPGLKAGPFGKTPRLDDLDDGDLKMSVDFRDVYATLLANWLTLPTKSPLGAERRALNIFA